MTPTADQEFPTGLYWKGKTSEVPRVSLPFQTVETINNGQTHSSGNGTFEHSSNNDGWYNRLIWGENKYIMSSLLDEFAGRIDLIYIDPPFATGADFKIKIEVGDVELTKEPSVIEEKAYRDTWGKGLDSYLQMMFERLIIMRDLLSKNGSIYVHCDSKVSSLLRLCLDEVFGRKSFRNWIIWHYETSGYPSNYWAQKHDHILMYSRDSVNWTFILDGFLYLRKGHRRVY